MSKFTTPLRAELIGNNKWKVWQAFEYHVGSLDSDEIIKVPKGFVTDFASVPRIIWPIISPVDTHAKAAVVHDYCYSTALYSRKRSDQIFLEALTVLKVSYLKRMIMYRSVRMIGWYPWRNHRKQK